MLKHNIDLDWITFFAIRFTRSLVKSEKALRKIIEVKTYIFFLLSSIFSLHAALIYNAPLIYSIVYNIYKYIISFSPTQVAV